MPIATVSKVGNGRAVFIPASVTDEAFALGNKVEIEYVGEGTLLIRSAVDDRRLSGGCSILWGSSPRFSGKMTLVPRTGS